MNDKLNLASLATGTSRTDVSASDIAQTVRRRLADTGFEIQEITGDDLVQLKKKLRYEISKEYGMYLVQKGDTLSEIGEGVGHPWRVLAELNNLENPHLIFPGQIIYLR